MEMVVGVVILSLIGWAMFFSVPLVMLLGPVLVFRWKKDGWTGVDLALLFLATVAVDATNLALRGEGIGMERFYMAHVLAGCGAALVGWFRGVLLRVLPRKGFSLYWALLLALLGVVSLLLAPRGNC